MARVLLFTDEPVLARGFSTVIASAAGFEPAAVCHDASELLYSAQAGKPDVVLVDLTAEMNFGILTQLRRQLPDSRVILWVRSISTEVAFQAMELGVRGVLKKTLSAELLLKCLKKVIDGELWFDKTLTASFLSARTVSLTRRESQLVGLLSQGLRNKEIAATLGISEGTVKVYLSRLFQKVGVKDRFELALYGLRNLQNMPDQNGAAATRAADGQPDVGRTVLRSLVLDRPEQRIGPQAPAWAARL